MIDIRLLRSNPELVKENMKKKFQDEKIVLVDEVLELDAQLRQIAQQAVYNATNTATLACLQQQVAALQGLTKVVIPTASICPEPMPRYNSWTAPAAPTTT